MQCFAIKSTEGQLIPVSPEMQSLMIIRTSFCVLFPVSALMAQAAASKLKRFGSGLFSQPGLPDKNKARPLYRCTYGLDHRLSHGESSDSQRLTLR
jgi:hypothetical protein